MADEKIEIPGTQQEPTVDAGGIPVRPIAFMQLGGALRLYNLNGTPVKQLHGPPAIYPIEPGTLIVAIPPPHAEQLVAMLFASRIPRIS